VTPVRRFGKLLVLGNIASGKSGLVRAVAGKTGWPAAGIDDARRQFGDGSAAGEARAWAHFLARAEERRPAVLECTGGGPFTHLLRHSLRRSGVPWAVLLVQTPARECLRRALVRGLDVPYPDFGVPLEEVVMHVERELNRTVGTAWPAPLCVVDGQSDPALSTARAVAELHNWLARETIP
jgi:hypothetical protein